MTSPFGLLPRPTPGFPGLRGLDCGVSLVGMDSPVLAGFELDWDANDGPGPRSAHEQVGDLRFDWRWSGDGWLAGTRSTLAIENRGARPVRIERVVLASLDAWRRGELELPVDRDAWAFYQHGWMSWTPTLVRSVVGRDRYRVPPSDHPTYRAHHQPMGVDRPHALVSSDLTLVGSPEGALLVGLLDPARGLSSFELDMRARGRFASVEFRRFEVTLALDGLTLAPGETWHGPALLWRWGEPERLLADYGALTGRSGGAASAPPHGGWCSWYYYFGQNDARAVEQNLAALEAHPAPARALDWVIIDDGHQQAIGDWLLTNASRYPAGLADVAARIRQSGRVPGLWVAPFCVGANSRLYADHPDWVVMREDGRGPHEIQRHWDTAIYGLDTTHPGARAYLQALFRVLAAEWGFGVLKLDFLHFGCQPGRRFDPTASRLEAFRAGLAIVREAVGPGVHLLGCGAPLAGALGLVDSMRVGQDVGMRWESATPDDMASVSTLHACMNTVHRFWQQGQWWVNDPDCLVLRGPEDFFPHTEPLQMTDAEKTLLATVVALSGGSMIASDPLTTLGPAAWRRIGQLLPPSGEAARWVDGFTPDWPAVLHLPAERPWDRWHMLGLLNWQDTPQTLALPLARLAGAEAWEAYDVWEARSLDALPQAITLPAHGAAILALRPRRAHPWLAGDDRHWAQGLVGIEDCRWDDATATLALRLEPLPNAAGTLSLRLPAGHTVASVVAPAETQLRHGPSPDGRGWQLALTVEGTGCDVRVCFTRP